MNTISVKSWPIWWPSNIAAMIRRFSVDHFGARRCVRGLSAHLEDRAWRLSFFGDELESIVEFDPLTGERTGSFEQIRIYANSHYVTPKPTMQQALISIKKELRQRLDQLVDDGNC